MAETKIETVRKCCVLMAGNVRCGGSAVYLTVGERGVPYTGWYHLDRQIVDHHAVPESWIR